MAKKIKLTRPELKRHRDMLARFERYLPMLKLKQQQLQLTMRDVNIQRRQVQQQTQAARARFEPYQQVLADLAGVDVRKLASPVKVVVTHDNIAGVSIPIFQEVEFAGVSYSLFATPAWVDRAIMDLRDVNRHVAHLAVLDQQFELLSRELTKIIQRVNLFEKIKIPESREAIRVIRIKLGDEMTAGVGRAKIAKNKLAEVGELGEMGGEYGDDDTQTPDPSQES